MVRASLVLSALLAPCGLAGADPESVHIDYGAPASCPDAAVFMRSLQARTTRFRLTEEEQRRHFFIRVTGQVSGFAGRLEIRTSDGRASSRRVDGAVCEEVAEALALMTALAIDPDALMTVPKAAGKNAGSASQKPPAEDAPQRAPSVTVVDSLSYAKSSEPWQWSVGALGHMTFGLSPTLGYGGQGFVEAEAPPTSKLGPALRAGILLNQSDVDLSTGAAARFRWALATVEGCPVRLAVFGQRLAVHPCVALRLGVLRGEGQRISQPQQTLSAWADAGPLLRLRFAVTARLILEVQGALVAPLYRPTFEITDMGTRTTAYSVPRLGGLVGMGLSYRFQ